MAVSQHRVSQLNETAAATQKSTLTSSIKSNNSTDENVNANLVYSNNSILSFLGKQTSHNR